MLKMAFLFQMVGYVWIYHDTLVSWRVPVAFPCQEVSHNRFYRSSFLGNNSGFGWIWYQSISMWGQSNLKIQNHVTNVKSETQLPCPWRCLFKAGSSAKGSGVRDACSSASICLSENWKLVLPAFPMDITSWKPLCFQPPCSGMG